MISPDFSFSESSIETRAVSPVSASAAASTCEIAAGFLATMAASIAIFSQ